MVDTDAAVLVVDEDPAVGDALGGLLRRTGIRCEIVRSAGAALLELARRRYAVVVTDVRSPDVDGMVLLVGIRAMWPATSVVMMTAHGSVPLAVEAMRRGAADLVVKPLDDAE